MPPAWKVRRGHLVFGSSVCPSVPRLSVCLFVRNSVPLTDKVQYLKFGWSCSYQTWTVSSSMGSLHFTDIPCPWGVGRGKNVGLRDFAIFWLCCCRGHPCFTNTCPFDFSETAEGNSTKLDCNQDLDVLTRVCVFHVDEYTKMAVLANMSKKVAHCTQVHDMWPFGPLVYLWNNIN